MDGNSFATLIFCSHICKTHELKPLEPGEWNRLEALLSERGLEPSDLLERSEQELRAALPIDAEYAYRLLRLMDRSNRLTLALQRYEDLGISALTRGDPRYPAILKEKLGKQAPPIFYYAGDPRLLEQPRVGYVGSRNITEEDGAFAADAVRKTLSQGYGVVSGGARGIDTVAETEALRCGSTAAVFLADSLLRRMQKPPIQDAVQRGKLLLLSVANPDAGFHTAFAMMRNRYIYAQSRATVVIRADLGKGGTWQGATDTLKRGWCPLLCRQAPQYPGNTELIRRGAIPIDQTWDGSISVPQQSSQPQPEQLSLFDL